MRNLTIPEIEWILAKHPKAKRMAVENFLITVGSNYNSLYASMNLGSDAQSYHWNSQTVNAIKEGIRLAS